MVDIKLINKYIERIKIDYPEDDKLMIDLEQFAQEVVKNCSMPDVSFPLFQDLYGSYVQMNDRFETVHIWSEELAMKNKGRWKPMLISKQKYDQEKQRSWNNLG